MVVHWQWIMRWIFRAWMINFHFEHTYYWVCGEKRWDDVVFQRWNMNEDEKWATWERCDVSMLMNQKIHQTLMLLGMIRLNYAIWRWNIRWNSAKIPQWALRKIPTFLLLNKRQSWWKMRCGICKSLKRILQTSTKLWSVFMNLVNLGLEFLVQWLWCNDDIPTQHMIDWLKNILTPNE